MLFENKSKCYSADPNLIYDEACLDLHNGFNSNLRVYGQYSECHGCALVPIANLSANGTASVLIDTRFNFGLHYNTTNSACHIDKLFYEHYRYGLNITDSNCGQIYIEEEADSAYLPILTAFIILFSFGTFWYMVKGIYRCLKSSQRWRHLVLRTDELENDLGSPAGGTGDATSPGSSSITNSATTLVIERPPPLKKHPHRVKSLDVFRGFCITLMIFVNYGGGQYWFFKHSIWNGLTFADLVFPWFLWIMGVSFMISLNNKLRRAVPRREIFFQVVKRSIVLMFLGFVLNSHGKTVPLSNVRIPGVLQRLGVCYLIVGTVESIFAKRTVSIHEYGRLSFLQDILVALPQWGVMFALVVIHTCITFLLDVPGCGRGYLGPGGLDDGEKFANCTGGATGYIDRAIFGDHMYKKATCRRIYETHQDFDPEGLLGTLTSVLLVYLGVQAGRILHTYNSLKARLLRWLVWGIVLCLIGGALCGFSKNDGVIPLNKNLWSLSFTLLLAGFAFIIEACLFFNVDITRKWGGRPLFYPGMNSIVLYIGHEVFSKTFPFAWTPVHATHASFLTINLFGTTLWVVVSIVLYKHNVFFNI